MAPAPTSTSPPMDCRVKPGNDEARGGAPTVPARGRDEATDSVREKFAQPSSTPANRFAIAFFSSSFAPRAIWMRWAWGLPAPCIDSVR